MRVVIANAATGDEQLGVIDTDVALAKAEELGLDLIMISETAVPPVCKVSECVLIYVYRCIQHVIRKFCTEFHFSRISY